jgi:hypothetical protein
MFGAASGYAVMLGHAGYFGVSRDLVNETCQCAYNTGEIHFRVLLFENNLNVHGKEPLFVPLDACHCSASGWGNLLHQHLVWDCVGP